MLFKAESESIFCDGDGKTFKYILNYIMESNKILIH